MGAFVLLVSFVVFVPDAAADVGTTETLESRNAEGTQKCKAQSVDEVVDDIDLLQRAINIQKSLTEQQASEGNGDRDAYRNGKGDSDSDGDGESDRKLEDSSDMHTAGPEDCNIKVMTKESFEQMIHNGKFVREPTVIREYLADTSKSDLDTVTALAMYPLNVEKAERQLSEWDWEENGIVPIETKNVEKLPNLPHVVQKYHRVFKHNMYPHVLEAADNMAPPGFLYYPQEWIDKHRNDNVPIELLTHNFSNPWYGYLVKGGSGASCDAHSDYWETAFWNGLLKGKKRWVLWSPEAHQNLLDKHLNVLTKWVDSSWEEFWEAVPRIRKNLITPNSNSGGHLKTCVLGTGDLLVSPGGWWHRTHNLKDSVSFSEQLMVPQTIPAMYNQICWGMMEDPPEDQTDCNHAVLDDSSNCITRFKDGLSRAYMCAGLHRVFLEKEKSLENYNRTCCPEFVALYANNMLQTNGMERMIQKGHTALADFITHHSLQDVVSKARRLANKKYPDPRGGRVPMFDAHRFFDNLDSTVDLLAVSNRSFIDRMATWPKVKYRASRKPWHVYKH